MTAHVIVALSDVEKLLIITALAAFPLLAADRSRETIDATHTDRFNVSAAGEIRIENSFGEVDIDGWDRPEVEVEVVRSTQKFYDPKNQSDAHRRLDSVQVTAKQNGNDVLISTAYPPRNTFLHPLSRRSDIDIKYRIHAPRASKVTVDENRGGVNVYDISGDIHATVINGQITLTLAPSGQYSIDAQSKLGTVDSDFEGVDRHHLLGEDVNLAGKPPAANLYLRVRVGDIVIQKLNGPPAD
jgi:hypothetical protein